MAIQTDYPRASLRRSLALAEAIDKLGGESSDESAADGIGNKVGGAFRSLVGAGVKFGLITNSKGRLKTAPLFQDYKLAYSEQQKQDALRRAFLTPPLYAALTKRFEGQQIPSHFEKLLIREYDVPEDYAQRLMGYFAEGAKDAGMLNAQGHHYQRQRHHHAWNRLLADWRFYTVWNWHRGARRCGGRL